MSVIKQPLFTAIDLRILKRPPLYIVGLSALLSISACSSKVLAGSNIECPMQMPPPYTDSLLIESKYDQSDKSKSRLKSVQDPKTKEIKRRVDHFTKSLVKFSEYLVHDSENKKIVAEKCMHDWLTGWATEGALLTDETSKTGKAVRKWALASLNSVIIKAKVITHNRFKLNETEKNWIDLLASKVISDYDKRLTTDFKYFNNHDHWAAWSVFSSGYLLKKHEYMDWAYKSFNKSLSLAKTGYHDKYAYFPIEVARSKLAVNYTHFSLTPLVLLEHFLPKAGYVVTEQQSLIMTQLVNFAVTSTLSPNELKDVLSDGQVKVEEYKLAWLIPYLATHKDHILAKKLYQKYKDKVDGYSLIGGRVQGMYER